MANISKLLVAGGLVILTGPLCFLAQAQDYIDVEAERMGSGSPSAPAATMPRGRCSLKLRLTSDTSLAKNADASVSPTKPP